MIEITIKTLDSQNHSFSVPDDTTVKQFKEKIFEKLPFPVDSQRLIYCGRVLQDDKNLTEYDVNGKVIHLVQRPPPQPSTGPSNRAPGSGQRSSSTGRERRFVGGQAFRTRLDGGNAMYLGAMAIPTDVMDASGIATPQPSQSLSQSRLTVARRMIRSAASTLTLMENVGAEPPAADAEPTAADAPPADGTESSGDAGTGPTMREVGSMLLINTDSSPVGGSDHSGFMPPSAAAVIASAFSAARSSGIASHMTISSRSGGAEPVSLSVNMDSRGNITHVNGDNYPASSSTESSSPPPEPAAEEGAVPTPPTVHRRLSRQGYARPPALATLLDELNRVNQRLQPFYERYHQLMRDDPAFEGDEAGATAANLLFTQVSEVLHCLSHAYHALSDIMCDFAQPPPRVLRCRPVLIQHSAVLQAGIPLNAQMSIFSNRAPGSGPPPASQPPGPEEATAPPAPTTEAGTTSAAAATTETPPPNTTPRQPRVRILHAGNPNSRAPPTMLNMSPGNVEFIMEVGPGSITIDSVEATLMSGSTAVPLGSIDASVLGGEGGSFPWGSPAPPEFLQHLMQAVAGQLINRSNEPGATPTTTTATPTTTTSTGAVSEPSGPASAVPGQNSTARGNTATHPTTSTQTRSTARPHVHLAQSMPSFGGSSSFDPFLPCNSHHVVRTVRRRTRPRTSNSAQEEGGRGTEGNTTADQSQGTSPDEQDALMNLLEGIIGGYTATTETTATQANQPAETGTTAPVVDAVPPLSPLLNMMYMMGGQDGATSGEADGDAVTMPMIQQIMQTITQGLGGGQGTGTTLADILQSIPDHNYVEGDSLFNDLIMTLARNLSFQDMLAMSVGRSESLNHLQPQLREFMVRRALLNDLPTAVNVGIAAERLTAELRPYLEVLLETRTRQDIDVVQTVNNYNGIRVGELIDVIVCENNPSTFGVWLTGWCRTYLREICAILRHCCVDGMVGLERILQTYVRQLTSGVPQAIQDWTTTSSLTHLRAYTAGAEVPLESIQRFLVLRGVSVDAAPVELPVGVQVVMDETVDEPMETDAADIETEVEEVLVADTHLPTLVASPETLPVIIPEAWHSALPTDWVPIISRDAQRQRRQNPQAPFSDAYLSGMPSKRRKVVATSKPQGTLNQVIADGVRHAVGVTGVPPNTGTLDTLAETSSTNPSVQAAYRDQVRSVVRDRLTSNPDYTPDKFPNTAKYFTKK